MSAWKRDSWVAQWFFSGLGQDKEVLKTGDLLLGLTSSVICSWSQTYPGQSLKEDEGVVGAVFNSGILFSPLLWVTQRGHRVRKLFSAVVGES